MKLEFHQLDRRYEHLRARNPDRQRRLMTSLATSGQQTPIVVIAISNGTDRYLVIDGYKRVVALEQLGRDIVEAVVWDMSEADALVLDRSMRFSEQETALEQGWLLQELERRFGYSLEDLARRFDRSVSWVSRRRWVFGLPGPSTAIVSLLGRKPDGLSEFAFYSFYGGFDLAQKQPGCLSFREWLDRWIFGLKIERSSCGEHPTEDFKSIPLTTKDAVVSDIHSLISEGYTVVLIDSGGQTRTSAICNHMGALEDS